MLRLTRDDGDGPDALGGVSCLFHTEQHPPEARLYLHSTLAVFTQDCRAVNSSTRERMIAAHSLL